MDPVTGDPESVSGQPESLFLPPEPGPLDIPLARAGIKGLTASIADRLAKGLDVHTVRDLLEQVPRRYLDLSAKRAIGDLKIGEDATIIGTIAKVDGRHVRSKRHLLTVLVSDGSGYLELVWWNQPFRARTFVPGATLAVAGHIERNRGKLSITNPFAEPLSEQMVNVGRVIPIHPATQGVTANQIRRFVHDALAVYGARMPDPLPSALRAEHNLRSRAWSIEQLHFPTSEGERAAARRRLVYEELFILSTGLAVRKRRIERDAPGIAHGDGAGQADRFLASLPFTPTGAQRRALAEIADDLGKPHPMNRLLQGEVGSGKTVVAVAAALFAHASGSQTALMAPTEVLAEQHYLTVQRMLAPMAADAPEQPGLLFSEGFAVELLTGSVTGAQRTRVLDAARSGRAMMLVGTHALIQEQVTFDRLGLAIVDEQHRFGVHQRISLREKGRAGAQPDVLIMTATPIPRTLALTLYGDLDVSTLDEMPEGRMPVITRVANGETERRAAYEDIRGELLAGRQAFIVCPLVEDSATLEAKAAETEYERIKAEVFPEFRIGLIHGRMRPAQKEEVMRAVRAGEVDVLVATTVIEVGVDIPNATIMVIEDADRFGLSQLHQLRGRIGRGKHAARCYLFTTLEAGSPDAREEALRRLKAMTSTNDGFRLAELDLEIRGSGQLFGRASVTDSQGAPAQAGRSDLRFASLARDLPALVQARADAFALVDADPTLTDAASSLILDEVRRRFADRLDWLFAS